MNRQSCMNQQPNCSRPVNRNFMDSTARQMNRGICCDRRENMQRSREQRETECRETRETPRSERRESPSCGCNERRMENSREVRRENPSCGCNERRMENSREVRKENPSCGCHDNRMENTKESARMEQRVMMDRERESSCDCVSDIPTGNRQVLLDYINKVSFAVYEAVLFLDTHPADQEALHFFHQRNRKRNAALREYERLYGPLTIETANDSCSRSWEWMQQPWPWEGGAC